MKRAAAAIAIAIVTGLMTGSAVQAQTPRQIEWVGDVPVMPGLAIESGLGFAFDSPEGRIVTIYLAGPVDEGALDRYYSQALDPLGWVPLAGRTWQREGETLTFRQVAAAGTTLWKITIRPD